MVASTASTSTLPSRIILPVALPVDSIGAPPGSDQFFKSRS
jgi:hypothetical protein